MESRTSRKERLGVFVGPSLPPSDRPALDGVAYLPPASRGSVIDAAHRFDAILLIDGVFHHDLAPTPRETVDTCALVPLYGAASLGALRAVESSPYGAVPLGAVAAWYAHEIVTGDDEVAVLMHPQTHRALSVPSVNVRYVARLGQRRGLLSPAEADRLVRGARDRIFYMDRTWEGALEFAPARVRADLRRIALREGDLKRWDARFALRSVLRRLRLATR